MKYLLLTGATGLVGRYLIRDLLVSGHRLAVVARGSEKESAHERIEGILQMWESQLGTSLPRPVILEGNVAAPSFGLSGRDLHWVRDHCDQLLNNAAIITFYGADRAGEPWRTNLNGAKNAVELCEQNGIKHFHHVSTAYVCGTRTDRVKEDELDVGQGFRNDYEESKFLAEKIVRSASFLRSLTVYRPAVIAGDSQTGYTSTYHGLYHYLKLMSVIARNAQPDENGLRHTPVKMPMSGDEPRNVVPVDWVSAVISRIVGSPELHGRTYHLAPRHCVTPRQVLDVGCRHYNSYGVEYLGSSEPQESPLNDIELAAQENMRIYESYVDSDPAFDLSNLEQAVPDLLCPPVDDAMIHRFLQFGELDRWGKRRSPRPSVPFCVGRFLTEELTRHHPHSDSPGARDSGQVAVGLNVYGPGGGQWSLRFTEGRLTSVTPGLPTHQHSVTLSSADFARLVQKNERLTANDLQAIAEWGRGDEQVGAKRMEKMAG